MQFHLNGAGRSSWKLPAPKCFGDASFLKAEGGTPWVCWTILRIVRPTAC
jgi:hypothetical protein